MPSRRRKFSVKKGINSRKCTNNQNDQSSWTDPDGESIMSLNISKFTNNVANSSKNSIDLYSITERDNAMSTSGERKSEYINTDVSMMSTLTKVEILETLNNCSEDHSEEIVDMSGQHDNRRNSLQNRDRNSFRREINPHQHRIKVRSPKRRMGVLDNSKFTDAINNYNNKQTTGTFAINWKQEFASINSEDKIRSEISEDEVRTSIHSLDDMCRICHGDDTLSLELGRLISACACRGTVGRVHIKCLERWLTESGKSRCELCGTRYYTRRVHRYGVPRALVMWIMSQNAKQLLVDSLGIMLMSPLAILAAWLSGRTLAGLMMQENRVTPWPLASTFVLACMTLVCYYCWVVSAATRHALGWWIWYRSQYEVRLQIQENED